MEIMIINSKKLEMTLSVLKSQKYCHYI